MRSLYRLALFIVLISCNSNESKGVVDSKTKDTTPLFKLIEAERSGINFANYIKETEKMNGLVYEYLYNGGGVSVSDYNADGLPDIYFISNQRSNEFYINKGGLKFEDVTLKSGLKGKYGFHTGVTNVDINSDGLMDIYICKSGGFKDSGKRKNELYINQGNDEKGIPFFEEQAEKYGLDLGHHSTQAAFFDYDKDGLLDMFLINHGIASGAVVFNEKELMNNPGKHTGEKLFKNVGGKFIDVTEKSGIISNAISFGLGIAVGDLNNDGWPDIIVGHDFYEKDHIYINQKNGAFKEVSSKVVKHISNFSMGNDIVDFNNDGLLDFISVDMVSNNNHDVKTSMSGMDTDRFYELTKMGLHHQYMYNTVQVNRGNNPNGLPVFSDVAQLTGLSNTDWSWAPLFFDMDNDGKKDLFVSNGIKGDFRNNDYVKFKEKEVEEFVKIVNQNQEKRKELTTQHIQKLLSSMPKRKKANAFFRNNGGYEFIDMADDLGFMNETSSNGAAYADLDGDGDLDIVVNNSDDLAFIYCNNTSRSYPKNNYLQIKLSGSKNNTFGIGSRVEIYCNGELQVQEQYLSRGFQSSIDNVLHFGLGEHDSLDSLRVIWPDDKMQILKNIQSNQIITLNYENAKKPYAKNAPRQYLFTDVTNNIELNYRHIENEFDDFERESLLPHRMSRFGPALAVGDINGDGLDDFYVGGAKDQKGVMYVQNQNGSFQNIVMEIFDSYKSHEDIGAVLFDADNDNDLDLYVVSGGNEFGPKSGFYQDRLYINIGNEQFKDVTKRLPAINSSGSVVRPYDYDNDGDLDLFVGGRQVPGNYPYPADSYLLQNNSSNGNIKFIDVTKNKAPKLRGIGMVTDAVWADIDNDNLYDLILTGEWMCITIFKNNKGVFENISNTTGLQNYVGWWSSIAPGDFDSDGDIDFIAGNLGLNYKYKASKDAPFEIYQNDFDNNGTKDIVLGFHENKKLYPVRGRECTSNQMPFVKRKYQTYNEFADATILDILGKEAVHKSLNYKATNFASSYIENNGDGTFAVKNLPVMAQISSVNSILVQDFNGDGRLDALLSGNLYVSEVETPRNDAGYGLLLEGQGNGSFKPIPAQKSNLFVDEDVKHSAILNAGNNEKYFLFAKNNDSIQVLKFNDPN